MAAKGGAGRRHHRRGLPGAGEDQPGRVPRPIANARHSSFFYQMLHAAGIFPDGAPPTVRMFSSLFTGQLTVEQMVDRYDLACRPVRDLLVDYLRERQPGIDYNTLTTLATTLALWFWKDLENHHPGISSLQLPPDIAAAWKQRIRVKPVRGAAGRDGATEERKGTADVLITVRSFYLDLSQWALDDPAHWGPWAVPCPVRASDVQYRKMAPAARPAWTSGPGNGCPCCPPWPLPSTGPAGTPLRFLTPPGAPSPASCSPPEASRCAAPRSDGHRRGHGPRTRRPGSAATSPARKTTRSGPGPRWRCSG